MERSSPENKICRAVKRLTCMYTNANSLGNKYDEFRCRVSELNPDIIGITEVWQKDKFSIRGYHPAFRKDRPEKQIGGGVLLLARDHLEVLECQEMNEDPFEDSVWCIVKTSKQDKTLIGVCYRSPSSVKDNNEKLITLLQKAKSVQVSSLLIMGDFNYNQVKWMEGYVEGAPESDAAKFYEATQDLYLFQHVTFPTRFREGCVPSHLDLIFTSEELAVDELTGDSPLGKSDHIILSWKYLYQTSGWNEQKKMDKAKPNYNKGNFKEMSEYLGKVNWSVLKDTDVEETWKYIMLKINIGVEKFVPPKVAKSRKSKKSPWWSNNLKREVKLKYQAWKEYTENRTPENYKKYTKQRNKTTQEIRKAKHKYETDIALNVKRNPKKLYGYIRNQQQVKAVVGALEDAKGHLTESDRESAEVLHSFFQSVFIKEDKTTIPDFPEHVSQDRVLSDIVITKQDVLQELQRLDSSKAPGPDGLSTIVLKNCATQLVSPLCILYQKTLDTGRLPQDWKQAKITPIYKKGTRKKASNYRPISLTSQASKVMERIIKRHMMDHLEVNNLLSKHQHGFMPSKSCQSNLLETFEEWTGIIDRGLGLDVIYLDYQKAFDTVPHERLLTKLSGYGLKGKILNWLKDFLHDRHQQVVINNSKSSWAKVTSGVPQGSVLGPVLFLVYVNELPSLVQCGIKMFADDVKLYMGIQGRSDIQKLQQDLDTLAHWSDKWLLKFSTSKCKVMHCGRGNPKTPYSIEQDGVKVLLEEITQERDLGVIVVDSLKPTPHCRTAAKKGMSALKLLKMAFSSINKQNFKPLYSMYVRSHLEYCIQAVGPYMAQDYEVLEKVQRRATKLVRGIKTLPYKECLRHLELPSIKERVLRGDLILTYKILTGKTTMGATQFFERNKDKRTRGHQMKLLKRRAAHHARTMFFSNRVVSQWNKLPENVISAPNTNTFKNRLDRHWAKTLPE